MDICGDALIMEIDWVAPQGILYKIVICKKTSPDINWQAPQGVLETTEITTATRQTQNTETARGKMALIDRSVFTLKNASQLWRMISMGS